MQQQKLFHTDFAYRDKRSIHAMLRGYGDGREQDFLQFSALHTELDELSLIEAYHAHIRTVENNLTRPKPAWILVFCYFLMIEPLEIWLCLQIPAIRTYLPF